MENKLLTIITVCFNSEKTIKRTIHSVLSQMRDSVEYIIVDGASTDNTLSIIKSFDTKKINLISEKDFGVYDAMNKGVVNSSGKWIYFLNSDDWLTEGIISYLENTLSLSDPYDFVYGHVLRHTMYDGKHWVKPFYGRSATELIQLKNHMTIHHQSLFTKRTAFNKLGGFDTSFKRAADWDLVLRGYLNGYQFYKINRMIANYTTGGLSGKGFHLFYMLDIHFVRKKNKLVIFDKYTIHAITTVSKSYFLKFFFPKALKNLELSGFKLVNKPRKQLSKRRNSYDKTIKRSAIQQRANNRNLADISQHFDCRTPMRLRF